jgi:hypothetical protein
MANMLVPSGERRVSILYPRVALALDMGPVVGRLPRSSSDQLGGLGVPLGRVLRRCCGKWGPLAGARLRAFGRDSERDRLRAGDESHRDDEFQYLDEGGRQIEQPVLGPWAESAESQTK